MAVKKDIKKTGRGAAPREVSKEIPKMVSKEVAISGDGHKGMTLGHKGKVSPVETHTGGTEELKDKPYYSDEVALRMVNLLYDPLATDLMEQAGMSADEAHLLSLTRINNSKEAWYWAQQIAKRAMFNKYAKGHKTTWSADRIQMTAFLLMRRSIPGSCGPGFMLGVGLAQEQNIVKAEEAGEESEW